MLGMGLIAAFGLGTLLAASEFAYTVLRWAGAAYLLYLGSRMALNARSGLDLDNSLKSGASPGGWLARGFITNVLNPKVGVFYIIFLPQFVPAGAEVMFFTVLLAAIHALEGILWFGLLIAANSTARSSAPPSGDRVRPGPHHRRRADRLRPQTRSGCKATLRCCPGTGGREKGVGESA
jgi:threonine/homoserine/homoserine lactone efflux protein